MKKFFLVVCILAAGLIGYSFYSDGSEIDLNADGELTNTDQIDFSIEVRANPISAFVVSLDVTTNLPLPVEVMASVSAKGQAPSDTYIGVSKRIKLTSSEQTIELDGSDKKLPSGEYVAEVTFYPRWGAENGTNQAKAIKQEIIGAVDVTLIGSGKSMDQADKRNIAQKWVMENVFVDTPWNESQFAQRMGRFEKTTSSLNLHDAYYFSETDMTIIVSRVKDTVAIWRFGKTLQ